MRYATIVVDPGSDGFYPEYQTFIEDANVRRERIHYINLLDDGTIVGLYELTGDIERIRSGLEALPQVLSYDITGTENVLLYLHEEATEPARSLLVELQRSEVVIDHPLEFMTDGTLRVTVIGAGNALRRTLRTITDVVDVYLEETGKYRPELRELASLLTDRQFQILQLAVDLGYYDVPRRATHQDIAEHVDISQSTVAEHLQKIEAKILSRIVR